MKNAASGEEFEIEPSLVKNLAPKSKYFKYLILGLIANATLWGVALIYLAIAKPVYISKWALILPGSGGGISVNLTNIGQTSSSSDSPFGNAAADPRANYQFLVTSEEVLADAAAQLKIKPQELGKPKVKLVDNTLIMELEVAGPSPQDAQRQSLAIYEALKTKLDFLRREEVAKREEGSQGSLDSAQEKLKIAQQDLSEYKAMSGLISSDQIKDLSNNIEQLRKQKAEGYALVKQTTNRLNQLSFDLNLSVPEAANAFTLQADQLFQQNLKDYSESSALMIVLKAKWGDNHPLVIKEEARKGATETALMDRASTILGRKVSPSALAKLNIKSDNSGGRESLIRDLVTAQSEQKGVTAQNQALSEQITELESRLKSLVQKETKLDNLLREVQVAQAIFTSTLAKQDLGKTDTYAVYPIIQIIAKPSLPEEQSSPNAAIVILGTGIASIFITAAIVILWQREETKTVKVGIIQPSNLAGS